MRFPIKITDNFILEPVMHTFGVKPESSYVELAHDHLEVRMGMWFHETFPLSAVSQVAPSEWPWWGGLGVKLGHHGVGVVGSTENIVNVKFREPQKARVLVEVEATQLWLSLEDPDGFLRAMSEACKIPVSERVPF